MKKAIFFLITALAALMIVRVVSADSDGQDDGHICFHRMDTRRDDQVVPEEFERFHTDTPGLFTAIDQDEAVSATKNMKNTGTIKRASNEKICIICI